MSYLVLYQKTRRSDERLIDLDTEEKLISWLKRNADGCYQLRVIKDEGGERDEFVHT